MRLQNAWRSSRSASAAAQFLTKKQKAASSPSQIVFYELSLERRTIFQS
jgi:hypothetical protein